MIVSTDLEVISLVLAVVMIRDSGKALYGMVNGSPYAEDLKKMMERPSDRSQYKGPDEVAQATHLNA